MLVDEASVAERLLRELCAEISPRLVIEFDGVMAHEPAPVAAPVDWPAAPPAPSSAVWPFSSGDATDQASQWRAPGADRDQRQSGAAPRVSQVSDPGAEIAALTTALGALAAQDPASLPEPQALVAEQIGGAADAEARLAVLREELVELSDSTRTQLARWEAALVVFARETDPSLLASGIGMLVDALLPNEHAKRARQAEDDRGLDLHRNTLGSGWHVKGDLDDQTGEMLATVLDAAAATDPAAPDDTRRHAEGQQALQDETVPPHQWPVDQSAPRSKRQQRHDAFKRGLQALLEGGVLGVRGKVAPHVAVTVDLDFVEGVPGSLPARTDHGARLSREQVRTMLCRSTFTRLVLDARRRVVEASHSQRTSTALERLILKVQGGAVCLGAGCARGPATGHRLIPHHGSLFSHTGTTELADTVPLCEIDHDHELHSKGRTILLKDGRVLGPEGWVRR